ncbi:MAG: amidohydrolase family protein [Burkholderiaceae bacterium]|nr:amidohydrolase family protein [Burkholderiaceae bacterium]MDP1968960.1 amidohydrolase family protein [Burkholderiaceae bacterium]
MDSHQTPPTFEMPKGACDSHIHLIGPHAQFPLARERLYTPGPATLQDLQHHQSRLGLERAVVVHATPQREDCAYLLHALRNAPSRLRGVAPANNATRAELLAMRSLGVRGIRLNLETGGMRDPRVAVDALQRAARQACDAGLHLQLHAGNELLTALAPAIRRLPAALVVDHFGRLDPAAGLESAGFRNLLDLVGGDRVYIKLSAFHRISGQPDYEDLGPFVRALARAGERRLLWGSDWPHPQRPPQGRGVSDKIDPYRPEDDGRCLNLLHKWLGDEKAFASILVHNTQELFEF